MENLGRRCVGGEHRWLVVWLLCALSVSAIFAQTQAINGSIRGRVVDQTAAPLAQVTVKVENAQTGFERTVITSEEGYYLVPNLPLGSYSVTIQKEGFDTERRTNVVLNAGTESVIDSSLRVGAVSNSIEVTGGSPIIESSRSSVGRTISHAEVDNAPLTSRNPYNFILFQPGVSGHPNAELGIPRTINTNGLVDRINYQMDGMVDTQSDRYGLRLFPIANIYVQEVQTISNSFLPEFGMTSGNIYNVITGSGTNQFHGEVLYIGRPTDASARPILLGARPKPDLTLNDVAVNAGGAIIKDRLFLFGAYEYLKRGLPQPVTIAPAAAAQLGIASDLLGTAPSVQTAQFVNLRADWKISDKHQFFARVNYFRNEYPFNTNVGGLFALDTASDFRDRAYIGGAQLLSTFTPNVLNELRFSDPYRNNRHVPNALNGPGPVITVAGIANFNGSNAYGDVFAEKIPSLNDNFTVVKGSHTFKVGGGFQQILDVQLSPTFSQYTFPNIPAYLAARSGVNPFGYTNFQTAIGTLGAGYHSLFWHVFGQDSWQVRPNLLINYGVRYDRFQSPDPPANQPFLYSRSFRTPGANFAPRLGLAWTLGSKTVLRASSGLFYEAPATNLWYNTIYNNGSTQGFVAQIGPRDLGAPAFPFIPSLSNFTRTTPDITTLTPNFKNAYTINSSFQISQQLTNNDALTVGYVNTNARNQVYLRNMNLVNPISTLADGRPVFGAARLYSQFRNITLQDVGANASYNAMIVNYQHRLTAGATVSASYTWSHSISDAPDANSFEQNLPIEDATNRRRDRGNSYIDRPHAFTLSADWAPVINGITNGFWRRLANGNDLAILAMLASGDAQNIVANQGLNGDQTATAVTRPLFVGRYTARGPNVYQIDARYTRTLFTLWDRVRPKFIAEANNVFNHPNITAINTTAQVNTSGFITTQPSLLPVSTTLEGRIIQLGVRCDW